MPSLDLATVNRLLNIDESFKAPDRLMELAFNKIEREHAFREFLKLNHDLSFDWFHEYFEEEQAEHKGKKQDFTPESVAEILTRLVPRGNGTVYEPTAGTGGIVIQAWWRDCLRTSPFTYMPHDHLYYCEELSDRAVPFLLFNLAIRGMNAIVFHGDVLERTCRGVFFVENSKDDFMKFSDINVMPYNDEIKHFFGVKKWVGDAYPKHIETDLWDWNKAISRNIKFKKDGGDIDAGTKS